jgi:hypothetical protein
MKSNCYPISVLLLLILFTGSCKKTDYVANNQIYGSATYDDLSNGSQPLPSGQKVKVLFNGVESSLNSFVTTDTGKYNFSPTIKGSYVLQFTFIDSLLQFDARLVQKLDLDTLRGSSSNAVVYSTTTSSISAGGNDKAFQQNVILKPSETGLKLQIMDDQTNRLPNVRVCIYSNKTFASQNAPYCGGCVAYLSSDKNGEVLFTGLQTQAYYINARADVGVVHLTNQWSDDMITTDDLQAGKILTKQITLK